MVDNKDYKTHIGLVT